MFGDVVKRTPLVDVTHVTKDGLDEKIMEVYDASKPVRDYLKKAMGI